MALPGFHPLDTGVAGAREAAKTRELENRIAALERSGAVTLTVPTLSNHYYAIGPNALTNPSPNVWYDAPSEPASLDLGIPVGETWQVLVSWQAAVLMSGAATYSCRVGVGLLNAAGGVVEEPTVDRFSWGHKAYNDPLWDRFTFQGASVMEVTGNTSGRRVRLRYWRDANAVVEVYNRILRIKGLRRVA